MNANRIMGGGPAFQKGIADKPKMKTTQILKRCGSTYIISNGFCFWLFL